MSQSEKRYNIWWGPPKKFSTQLAERKISWTELFFDLVYVILISQATHHLYAHYSTGLFADYLIIFSMIFWGWLNGSLYYDLHGTTGIRTRFMMLWQIMAAAALAVTLNGHESFFKQTTLIAFLILEVYIIYLWWSVGIYDKLHRRLNRPYTFCFLLATALLIASLRVEVEYKRVFWILALFFNYFPPFLVNIFLRRKRSDITLQLSGSMAERLSILTIILLGEVILGIINGMGKVTELNTYHWGLFGLCILIAFAMWWLLFSLTADRPVLAGNLNWHILPLLYIPMLAALGTAGALFSDVPAMTSGLDAAMPQRDITLELLGSCLAAVLVCICLMSAHLDYPKDVVAKKRWLQLTFLLAAGVIFFVSFFLSHLNPMAYLTVILAVLFSLVFLITRIWFFATLKQMDSAS